VAQNGGFAILAVAPKEKENGDTPELRIDLIVQCMFVCFVVF
jgi:hypothetical protein